MALSMTFKEYGTGSFAPSVCSRLIYSYFPLRDGWDIYRLLLSMWCACVLDHVGWFELYKLLSF